MKINLSLFPTRYHLHESDWKKTTTLVRLGAGKYAAYVDRKLVTIERYASHFHYGREGWSVFFNGDSSPRFDTLRECRAYVAYMQDNPGKWLIKHSEEVA